MAPESILRLRVRSPTGQGYDSTRSQGQVAALGHDVIARESSLPDVARMTAAERPDVALVMVHEATNKALQLIGRIVHEAAFPVIAVLDVQDRDFINEAAKRGIFAYIADGHDPQEMQSAIDIVLCRFAEYHDLEGAFARRAVIERAKGILMERHDTTKSRPSACFESGSSVRVSEEAGAGFPASRSLSRGDAAPRRVVHDGSLPPDDPACLDARTSRRCRRQAAVSSHDVRAKPRLRATLRALPSPAPPPASCP